MIVLQALFNDLPIMMIAYDNAPIAPRPVRWDMGRVLTIASVLGTFGVFSSFGVFWIAWDYLRLAPALDQSVVFLKLLVAGHMTIYLTRNRGPIWERPLPSWKLIVPCEGTQIEVRWPWSMGGSWHHMQCLFQLPAVLLAVGCDLSVMTEIADAPASPDLNLLGAASLFRYAQSPHCTPGQESTDTRRLS